MNDVLVRGGTVVDGSGAAAFRADVRVRGGVIAEIGQTLAPDGELEIDAGDAYVTPGIIETHTHLDGAMWWNPGLDPLPAYGNTSLVLAIAGTHWRRWPGRSATRSSTCSASWRTYPSKPWPRCRHGRGSDGRITWRPLPVGRQR